MGTSRNPFPTCRRAVLGFGLVGLVFWWLPLIGAAAESCIVYVGDNGRPEIDQACQAAVDEARAWPDYDSTSLGDQVRRVDAAIVEAAGWSNFDSTAFAGQVQKVELAGVEAAGWPNFDSGNPAPVQTTDEFVHTSGVRFP